MSEGTTAVDDAADDDALAPGRPRAVLGVLRGVPFTIAVVVVMLVLGISTRTLWDPLVDRDLMDVVAYGLPPGTPSSPVRCSR